MKMMNVLFLCFVLTSPMTGAIWSSYPHHHHQVIVKEGQRLIIEFEEDGHGNTEVLISEHDNSGMTAGAGGFTDPREFLEKCRNKLGSAFKKTKNVVSEKAHELQNIEQHAKDVIDEAVGGIGEPKEKPSEKLSEKVKSVGEMVMEIAPNISFGDITEGKIKDTVVKMENWDVIYSPKRIGEDIERNASLKIEQGVAEVKETVENVKEISLNELLTRPKNAISDVLLQRSLHKIRTVISWCYLLGFSTAYGMGVWVTFFSSYVLGKCLPKQQFAMMFNKMDMVYFRAMAICVGAALFGFLAIQGQRGVLSNKMVMFQGFNLVSALCMILTNLIFLELRATKLIVERRKETNRRKTVAAEKLKKMNAYSSTINASTMVVLTWHLTYIGQLLQARH